MNEKIKNLFPKLEKIKTELKDLSKAEAEECSKILDVRSDAFKNHHQNYQNLNNAKASIDEILMWLRKIN